MAKTRKKKIIWERSFYEFDVSEQKFIAKEEDEDAVATETGDFGLLYLDGIEPQRVMNTPMGLFSIDDALNPYKQYTFYMMHTNFKITDEIEHELLNEIEGVEVLIILSPYRALIAFGKVFDAQEVRLDITSRFTSAESIINNIEIANLVNTIKKDLQNYPAWTLYVYPNGEYETCYLLEDKSNQLEYNSNSNKLYECYKISQGILLSHD